MSDTPLSFHICLNYSRKSAAGWGDTPYAAALARAIQAQGVETKVFFRGESPQLSGHGDVVLHIVGPMLTEPFAGLPNIVWAISPPNIMLPPALKRFQKIFIASKSLVERLRGFDIASEYLAQATDPVLFHPEKRPEGSETFPIVFVGAHASRAHRPAVTGAVRAGLDVHVWGPGWKNIIPARNWRGQHLDQDELAAVYASARIVLNEHMPHMAFAGMMSNRTYDALASGAIVVADQVRDFSTRDLPGLIMPGNTADMVDALHDLTRGPEPNFSTRMARHEYVARNHSLDAAAKRLIAAARDSLRAGGATPHAFSPRKQGLAPPILLSPVTASAPLQHHGLVAAAKEISQIFDRLEYPLRPEVSPPTPIPKSQEGVLHALMPDLRKAQQLLLDNVTADDIRAQGHCEILLRARRVLESGQRVTQTPSSTQDATMTQLIRKELPWAHSPDDFNRDHLKEHIVLWPRKAAVRPARPLAAFVHLYYHELGPVFAERLSRIDAPLAIYISTDTDEKARLLRRDFPDADIRVMPNRGRDIYPKFFGFSDVYDRHDLVLHLHGKKSRHSNALEEWLEHNLDCLLPSGDQINRILSLFETTPRLGLIAPVVFKPVISAAHWGANQEIAQELCWRMGLSPDAMPGNETLRFPVGSMFWGRTQAIQPLLDLKLQPEHFPPEFGQINGTTAHAIERMVNVCCEASGYRMISVAPRNSVLYTRYQRRLANNRALREYLS